MAVTQSQYNFVKFSANGDALNFKGILAGFIISKTAAAGVAGVQIKDYSSAFDIVPPTVIGTNACPIVAIMFAGNGIPVNGIKTTICSGLTVVAIKR
jgi:hypothetical protein